VTGAVGRFLPQNSSTAQKQNNRFWRGAGQRPEQEGSPDGLRSTIQGFPEDTAAEKKKGFSATELDSVHNCKM
jgi:hypothetical protein